MRIFSSSEKERNVLIVRPVNADASYPFYMKFKVGKSGFLWGYWDAGNNTKSGFYRDGIIYVGEKYAKARIEFPSRREIRLILPE